MSSQSSTPFLPPNKGGCQDLSFLIKEVHRRIDTIHFLTSDAYEVKSDNLPEFKSVLHKLSGQQLTLFQELSKNLSFSRTTTPDVIENLQTSIALLQDQLNIVSADLQSSKSMLSIPTESVLTDATINVPPHLVSVADDYANRQEVFQIILTSVPNEFCLQNILLRIHKIGNFEFHSQLPARTKGSSHWIFSTTYFQDAIRATTHKPLVFGTTLCLIKPYHKVIRCSNCQSFDHGFQVCKNPTRCEICSLHHTKKFCQADQPSCANCILLNSQYGSSFSTCHRASARNCPSYLILRDKPFQLSQPTPKTKRHKRPTTNKSICQNQVERSLSLECSSPLSGASSSSEGFISVSTQVDFEAPTSIVSTQVDFDVRPSDSTQTECASPTCIS